MAELFFIATTLFVAYVFFVVMGDKKGKSSPAPASKPAPTSQATAPAAVAPITEAISSPAAATPAARKPRTTKAATASKPQADSLKNPKTGETAKVPASYSFAKRWIKDALVEEGLLDKVYKNNELDADTTAKIQAALIQLRGMDKYQ